MDYKVLETASASADLAEIVEYIAIKLANTQAAGNLLDKILESYTVLKSQPNIFPLSRNPLLAAKGYRWFGVGSYMVFFTVDDEKMQVTIARVVYGARNLNLL